MGFVVRKGAFAILASLILCWVTGCSGGGAARDAGLDSDGAVAEPRPDADGGQGDRDGSGEDGDVTADGGVDADQDPVDHAWTQLSPPGGFVSALAFDPADPGRVWLSGDDASGLYLRTAPDAAFELVESAPVDWSAYTLIVHPAAPGVVYAPNHFGRGLARSDDGGRSWEIVGQGLPASGEEKRVNDLCLLPGTPDILVAATAGGLFRSVDGGDTFTRIEDAAFAGSVVFEALAADATAGRLFAGDVRGGVYRSDDGGAAWEAIVAPAADGVPVSDLAVSPSALYVAYHWAFLARSESLTAADYTVINDVSDPQAAISSGMWTRLRVVPGASRAEDRLYIGTVYLEGDDRWGFFASPDGGDTFERRDEGLGGASAFSLAVDPSDPDHLLLGTINAGVFESADAGRSWRDVSAGVFATDSLGVALDPSDPLHILFSSTAGLTGTSRVFESFDAGAGWSIVDSLDAHDVLCLALDPDDPLHILAGTFRRGVLQSTAGSPGPWSFSLDRPAAVRGIVFGPHETDRVYLYTDAFAAQTPPEHAGLYVSPDGGASWTRRLDFGVMDVAAHPDRPAELVAASGDLLATTDRFQTITSLGLAAAAPDELFTAIAFDPEAPATLLAGTASGALWLTNDYRPEGGCTWQPLPSPAHGVVITDLEIVPTEAGRAWYAAAFMGDVVFERGHTPGVLRSEDQGQTWAFLEEGLYPSRLTWSLTPIPGAGTSMLVGMWGGGLLRLDD